MGDMSSPVATKTIDNHQEGAGISWNNCVQDNPNPLGLHDNPNDDWKVTFSPHGAFIKNHKGSLVHSIEPYDHPRKDSFLRKSTNWKDVVEATSPIVSSFLDNQNPSSEIDVLGTAIEKLTSDAGIFSPSKHAKAEKSKGKSLKAGDNSTVSAKQTAKSKMQAEVNKRRRAKMEEEKKIAKQSKDDSNRTGKSCAVCGVSMADGPRTICKSCMVRQKRDRSRDKSRDKTQVRETKPKVKSPTNNLQKEETLNSDLASAEKVVIGKSQSPVKTDEQSEETPTRNRSLSLDIAEATNAVINMKYSPQKRTNTDLGPNSLRKLTQDKATSDIAQTSPARTDLKRRILQRHSIEANTTPDKSKESAISLDYTDKAGAKLPGIGSRVMKRSTTDSEIVSKHKSKPIKSKDHETAFQNSIGRQQMFDESKKKVSPRPEKKDASGPYSKQSSQETITGGMKLERSKTVMGKMNVEGDKKPVLDLERTRKKEGSNVSAESEKTYSNKKYTNPARSHTIIGDGHNKRQKNRGDWVKPKGGKGETLNGNKDAKKKIEKKSSPVEDEGRRVVSFVEGDTLRKMENEEAAITCMNTAMPFNLYDCVPDDDDDESSSDSEGSISITLSTKASESSLSSKGIPEEVLSRGIPLRAPRNETKETLARSVKGLESYKNVPSNSGSSGYDSVHSMGMAEQKSNRQVSRWSEEMVASSSNDYETMLAYGEGDADDEEENQKDDNSEGSYAERYLPMAKIEEEEEDDDGNESGEENYDNEEVYTRYPSREENEDMEESVKVDSSDSNETYFAAPITHTGEHWGPIKKETDDLYTTHTLNKYVPNENEAVVSYRVDPGPSPRAAAYTESSYTGHWTQAMIGNGDSAQTYFNAYETDVDTGLSVLHPQNEKEWEKPAQGNANEWGFASNGNDDNSSSSDDDDDQIHCSDSWYTGGYYDEKSEASGNNDDLIYFNDKAAKKLNESEIYTGDLYSKAIAKGNGPTDMSKNNNITLEDNLFEGSNFWIISSRPQMHQMKWDRLSRSKTMSPLCGKGHCGDGTLVDNLTWFVCDVSNNNNDEDGRKTPSSCEFKVKCPVQIASKSDYTEYTPEFLSPLKTKRPEIVLLGNKDFSIYDRQEREGIREDRVSFRKADYHKADTLFFGDESPRITKPMVTKPAKDCGGLYFNKPLPPMCSDSSPEMNRLHYPRDDDYQGGFFYATRYESNNSNNNNDNESESYTGCFRNEEEYKPTHDGLFNDKASSFVFQKRAPEHTPLYFSNVSSKSYYDTEESVYAFEKKKEKIIKRQEEPKKIFKIGSIVVRNNVECEVDYAQNIDMDSQDVPKTWMRYNYGGDSNVADTSSYAQNVSFEELGGAKPWVLEGCRAPWKMTKEQMKEKKSKDDLSNKNSNGSWKPTPDNFIC